MSRGDSSDVSDYDDGVEGILRQRIAPMEAVGPPEGPHVGPPPPGLEQVPPGGGAEAEPYAIPYAIEPSPAPAPEFPGPARLLFPLHPVLTRPGREMMQEYDHPDELEDTLLFNSAATSGEPAARDDSLPSSVGPPAPAEPGQFLGYDGGSQLPPGLGAPDPRLPDDFSSFRASFSVPPRPQGREYGYGEAHQGYSLRRPDVQGAGEYGSSPFFDGSLGYVSVGGAMQRSASLAPPGARPYRGSVPTGPVVPLDPEGSIESAGAMGSMGAIGSMGSAGPRGPIGPMGSAGPGGSVGPMESQGSVRPAEGSSSIFQRSENVVTPSMMPAYQGGYSGSYPEAYPGPYQEGYADSYREPYGGPYQDRYREPYQGIFTGGPPPVYQGPPLPSSSGSAGPLAVSGPAGPPGPPGMLGAAGMPEGLRGSQTSPGLRQIHQVPQVQPPYQAYQAYPAYPAYQPYPGPRNQQAQQAQRSHQNPRAGQGGQMTQMRRGAMGASATAFQGPRQSVQQIHQAQQYYHQFQRFRHDQGLGGVPGMPGMPDMREMHPGGTPGGYGIPLPAPSIRTSAGLGLPPGVAPDPHAQSRPHSYAPRGGLHREAAMNVVLTRIQTLVESGSEGIRAVTQIQDIIGAHRDDPAFRDEVIQAAYTHFIDLAMNQYGSKLLQYIVVNLSSGRAYNQLVGAIIEHSFQLSRNNYGCLVIQDFLRHCDIQPLLLTVQQFKVEGRLLLLAKSKTGNHVVQKLISSLTRHSAYQRCYDDIQDVALILLANPQDYLEMAYKICECRVYQKLFPYVDAQRFSPEFQSTIRQHFWNLCTNQWANFTIQALLENPRLAGGFRVTLVDSMIENLISLSRDRYGSRVVEHFLDHCNMAERVRVYLEFLRSPCFSELMHIDIANFVVQRLLQIVPPNVYTFASHLAKARRQRAQQFAEAARKQFQAAARNRALIQDGFPFDIDTMGAAAADELSAEQGLGLGDMSQRVFGAQRGSRAVSGAIPVQGQRAQTAEETQPAPAGGTPPGLWRAGYPDGAASRLLPGAAAGAAVSRGAAEDVIGPLEGLEIQAFDAACDFLRLVAVRYCYYHYLCMHPHPKNYSNIETYIRKAGSDLTPIEPCSQETALQAIQQLVAAGGQIPGRTAAEAVMSLPSVSLAPRARRRERGGGGQGRRGQQGSSSESRGASFDSQARQERQERQRPQGPKQRRDACGKHAGGGTDVYLESNGSGRGQDERSAVGGQSQPGRSRGQARGSRGGRGGGSRSQPSNQAEGCEQGGHEGREGPGRQGGETTSTESSGAPLGSTQQDGLRHAASASPGVSSASPGFSSGASSETPSGSLPAVQQEPQSSTRSIQMVISTRKPKVLQFSSSGNSSSKAPDAAPGP